MMRLILVFVTVAMLAGSAHAQTVDGRTGAVTATVVAQSRLLASGGASAVYDGVHPDLRNRLPRRAFAIWIAGQPYAAPSGDPVVTGISFVDWVSPVTGKAHAGAAFVSIVQPATWAGSPVEIDTTWVFAFDGERWRWLPDVPAMSIPGLIAAIDDFPGGYESAFRQSAYRAIDRFWQGEFYAANLHYVPPVIVPVTADQVDTGCGTVTQVKRLAIFYCVYDGTMYFDPAFRAEVLEETGPFGWSAVLAHEWGHHVQALVGAEAGRFGSDPVDLELQADCLSAIVAQDSVARGEIALDDVVDAIAVIQLAGDVPGTDPSDPHAHGSANERMAWFEAGFDRGFAGCDFSMRSG